MMPNYHPLPDEVLYRCFCEKGLVMAYVSNRKEDVYHQKTLKSYIACRPSLTISEENENIFFDKVDEFIKQGYFVGTLCSYEKQFKAVIYPFENVTEFNHHTGELILPPFLKHDKNKSFEHFKNTPSYYINPQSTYLPYSNYQQQFQKVQEFLQNGDCYQINLTFKKEFNFYGSPLSFYYELKNRQKVSYSFITRLQPNEWILSFSPELFFHKSGRNISMKPMKGTSSPGNEDVLLSEKNKSENIMIVDLIRNDLGKISTIGSVKVSQLFKKEEYSTISQMISEVTSTLKENITTKDIFSSLFPSGSVTGAPKKRAMSIIKELEQKKRGLYTGAIGYFIKDQSVFSVSIRTLIIKENQAELGIGSGITHMSSDDDEYNETLSKSLFLNTSSTHFDLIETLLWTGQEIKNKSIHLDRLENSAHFFDFLFNRQLIENKLNQVTDTISPRYSTSKIRLLLNRQGKFEIQTSPYGELKAREACFSQIRTQSDNIFLQHKTSLRGLYQHYRLVAQANNFVDCIFLNEKEEVTEGSQSNVFFIKKGQWYTPHLKSGLLPGIERCSIIREKGVIQTKVAKADLLSADRVYLSNSCMGCVEIYLVNQEL